MGKTKTMKPAPHMPAACNPKMQHQPTHKPMPHQVPGGPAQEIRGKL